MSAGSDMSQQPGQPHYAPPPYQPFQTTPPPPPRRRNWLLIGCLSLFGISLVCGLATLVGITLLGRGAATAITNAGTSVAGTISANSTAVGSGTGLAVNATVPATSAGTIGDRFAGRNYAVTVHETRDNVPLGRFEQAKPGTRRYAVELSITNTGTEPLSWSAIFGKVRTTENREFPATIAVVGELQPTLSGGSLNANETTRGWLIFEVPSDAQLTQFVYDSLGQGRVAVNLR